MASLFALGFLAVGAVLAADRVEKGDRSPAKSTGAGTAEVQPAQVADAVVRLTNAFRQQQGRDTLTGDARLAAAAQAFAEYMARSGRYGHEADGRTPIQRAQAEGYDYCIVAENIGYRYRSTGFNAKALAEALSKGWETSPPHRYNMLDRDITDIGVGVAHSSTSGRWYGVQMFGLPQSASNTFSITNASDSEVGYRLGGRAFDLGPRVTRTHERCRPADLAFDPADGETRSVTPEAGANYHIVRDATGHLQLRTR